MAESGWVKRRMIRWMEDNRGLILTVLGLPLSFLFDLVMQVRNWTYRVFLASPARHQERVAAIQRQVRDVRDVRDVRGWCNPRTRDNTSLHCVL